MFRRLKPYQLAIDIVIAVVWVLLSAGYLSMGVDHLWTSASGSAITILGMSAALGFRRVSPAIALGVAWLTAVLQMVGGQDPAPWDLAVLAVLFATAAYGTRVVKWLGFASVFVGSVIVTGYVITFPALQNFALGDLLINGRQNLTYGGLLTVVGNSAIVLIASFVLFMLSWVLGLLAKTFATARDSKRAQARAELEQLRAQQDVMVEQERTRIARDMHDVVAHSLAVVIAQADGAWYVRETDPAAVDDALTTISSTAREALGDVRILLGQLRHSQGEVPQPVLDDLPRLLDQLRASGLTIGYQVVGESGPLGTGQQLAVYRIVQESLTNALRHGDTGVEVDLELRWTPDAVDVTVTNAPRGELPEPLRPGHGLAGMRERAVLVGGRLAAEQLAGHFVVRASIPRLTATTDVIPVISMESAT